MPKHTTTNPAARAQHIAEREAQQAYQRAVLERLEGGELRYITPFQLEVCTYNETYTQSLREFAQPQGDQDE